LRLSRGTSENALGRRVESALWSFDIGEAGYPGPERFLRNLSDCNCAINT
jgi:hypothetical protein